MKTLLVQYLLLHLLISTACQGQEVPPRLLPKKENPPEADDLAERLAAHDRNQKFLKENPDILSEFIRRIYQDSRGHYWLGTNGDGVIHYSGDSLQYLSIEDGFGGVAVRAIKEDLQGNIWFATERGITKYDYKKSLAAGKHLFTNFTTEDGLVSDSVWSLTIDNAGIIWIGTLEGVSTFDGKVFDFFELPETNPDPTRGITSAKIVHSIMQDADGSMWFGTNGGAYIYDGVDLTNISTKDGLCGDVVNDILKDSAGLIWFATHHNGVCYLADSIFTHVTSIPDAESWSLYEDSKGDVWFPVENHGLHQCTVNSQGDYTLKIYDHKDGLACPAVQTVYEDRAGRVFVGGYLGLFLGTSNKAKTQSEKSFRSYQRVDFKENGL